MDDLTEIKGYARYAIGCLHAMISDIARCQVPNFPSRLCLFLRSQNLLDLSPVEKKNPGWLAGLFSDINWEGSSI